MSVVAKFSDERQPPFPLPFFTTKCAKRGSKATEVLFLGVRGGDMLFRRTSATLSLSLAVAICLRLARRSFYHKGHKELHKGKTKKFLRGRSQANGVHKGGDRTS